MSQKQLKRIRKELNDLQKEPIPGITAEPVSEANIRKWKACVDGPVGSPYEGGKFELRIEFGDNYPFDAPKVTFVTKLYHCNVQSSGYICLDILKNAWSPALTIAKVLLSITSLLTDPNPNDPLVPKIATQYSKNRAKHDQTAAEWTKRYAMPKSTKKAKKTNNKKRKAPTARNNEPREIIVLD